MARDRRPPAVDPSHADTTWLSGVFRRPAASGGKIYTARKRKSRPRLTPTAGRIEAGLPEGDLRRLGPLVGSARGHCELGDEEDGQDGGNADHLGPADVADHALTSGPFERPDRHSVALGAQLVAASRRCRDMASVADYQTALREVRARAEALGLGYAGARPRALFDVLKTSLPALARPVDAFRRPGQRRAQRRVLAQCEELMVTVAAAMHTRDVADEERAVEEARRLCRLLVEVGPALDLSR